MKKSKALPTQNKDWGLFGTCEQNGYKTAEIWMAATDFFMDTLKLQPEQTRTLLDAKFGRHLCDDFSFINGEINKASVIKHLNDRYADAKWRKHFEKSIFEVTGVKIASEKPTTKEELFTEIAKQHLLINTLVETKSGLDFHEVAVWTVKAALEAAYQAGLNAKKGA